jgi:S-adenosylmethionine hydrolase
MDGIITLTTDFGSGDAYVAAVKGVILTINPRATIVDICHSIKPQNIFEAAFIISTIHNYFPKGTIHVVVVDPGVGSSRKALILKTHSALFLAPDNGVLSYIVAEVSASPIYESNNISLNLRSRKLGGEVTAINITNPEYWQKPVSTTFHGRDIFAPVAAYLSLGVPVNKFGKKITRIHVFPIPRPYQDAYGNIIGLILHIDSFGNLITNIKSTDLKTRQVNISLGAHCIRGISSFYAQGKGLMALIGSNGYLEISFAEGSAAAVLNARVGDTVTVSPNTTL